MSFETEANGEQKQSEDGHKYMALSVPTTVTLDCVDFREHVGVTEKTDANPRYHLYVRCNEIAEKGLPIWEANPREPTRTPQVKNMQETLQRSPVDFLEFNNGMTLLADNIDRDNQSVTITMSESEGVCNGGHTYFALSTMEGPISDEAIVKIEVILIEEELSGEDKRDRIVDISSTRNNHKQLADRSMADQLQYYDYFKQAMTESEEKTISWHEGDSKVYSNYIEAEHFLRLLKTLDPLSYRHGHYNEAGKNHRRAVQGTKRIHTEWFNQMENASGEGTRPLEHLTPMIPELLSLRDLIAYSFTETQNLAGNIDGTRKEIRSTNLFSEYIKQRDSLVSRDLHTSEFAGERGVDYPATLEALLIGLFRTNIWLNDSNETKLVGWFVEPNELWQDRQITVLSHLADCFTDADSDPIAFIRTNSPYAEDVYQIGTYQSESTPQIIRDRDTKRYELTEDVDEATHWYQEDGKLIPLSSESRPNTEPLYIQN